MTLAIKNYEVGLDDDKLQQLSAAYVENTPKVLFVLVPVLALILTLFFRQSGRLFVEHAIFSLHIHAFIFALVSFILVLTTAITALAPSFIPAWSWYGRSLAGTGIIITYGYLALRRVYGVSRLATATKSLVVFVVYMAAYVAASIANICLTIILT
jgi:hypothetical protein